MLESVLRFDSGIGVGASAFSQILRSTIISLSFLCWNVLSFCLL